MLRGIDVSAVQDTVDFKAARQAGIRFAYVKAAEGNRPAPDSKFRQNVDGARAAGIWTGCYNFAYPLPTPGLQHDPVEQARHHFDLSGGLGKGPGELPPMLDFEWPAPSDWKKWGCERGQLVDWCARYLVTADALWEGPVGIYTYPDFWNHLTAYPLPGIDPELFGSRPLWMADYRTNGEWPDEGDSPGIVAPWSHAKGQFSPDGLPIDWTVWQIGQRMLPGSRGGPACDLDVANLTEDQMRVLAGGNP